MLVDKYALTKSFGGLLSLHGSQPGLASFARRVEQSMSRMDPLLKTLQVRAAPPEGLVQAYLIHIADRSDGNFRKILELKGVRKQDQAHLMELFAIHHAGSSSNDKLVHSSALVTPLMAGPGPTNPGAAAAGARFEAGSLGEKLLSAARDIGTSGGAADRGAERATMNENLRNFGRFFKDFGALGARFGKRDGSLGADEGGR